jgi:MSHA biogenesis protein MshP
VRRSPASITSRGFTTVAATFLTTILALISAYLIGLRVYQDGAFSLDALGTRAYAAARAGAEWGAYRSLHDNACAGATSVALAASLADYTVTVTCARSVFSEGAGTVNVDTIVANACNQPSGGACPNASPAGNYAERQVTLTVAR